MLSYRLQSLEALPEVYRALYRPSPDGKGFILKLDGLPPQDVVPQTAAEPQAQKRSQREIANDARDALVQRILSRIRPKPEEAAAAARFVADRIEVLIDADTGRPIPRFLSEPNGLQLPSGRAGVAWADEDEFAQRLQLPDNMLEPGPERVTPQEAALRDSEPFVAPPRNVRITKSQAADFRTWEKAREEARKRGGELVIVDDPAGNAPAPASWKPNGKDVPLTVEEARDFKRYEAARAAAAAQGGIVLIVGDPMQGRETMPA